MDDKIKSNRATEYRRSKMSPKYLEEFGQVVSKPEVPPSKKYQLYLEALKVNRENKKLKAQNENLKKAVKKKLRSNKVLTPKSLEKATGAMAMAEMILNTPSTKLIPDDVTLSIIADYARFQATYEEMAGRLKVDRKTFEDFRKAHPIVEEIIEQNRKDGLASLRSKQYTTALDGNVPMMIHLGKHLLGQHDKASLDVTTNTLQTLLKQNIQEEYVDTEFEIMKQEALGIQANSISN